MGGGPVVGAEDRQLYRGQHSLTSLCVGQLRGAVRPPGCGGRSKGSHPRRCGVRRRVPQPMALGDP
eukprot:3373154-Lingulodinium_polyedra.AAC.1